MNISLLKSFLTVAKCKSFTQAAQTLNFTQPAISNHIAILEKLYGVQLFQRNGKTLSLTKAGSAFFTVAMQINDEYENSLNMMKVFSNPQQVLKIAISAQFINYFLMDVVSELHNKYPDMRIEVHRCMTVDKTLQETFVENTYDLAFLNTNIQPLDTVKKLLWHQKIVWAVSNSLYTAHNQSTNIYEYPYIAYPDYNMYNLALKDSLDFQRLNPLFIYSDAETIIQAILHDLGIGLVPKIKIEKELKEKNIIAFPMRYGIELPVFLMYSRSLVITPEIKYFFYLLGEFAQKK